MLFHGGKQNKIAYLLIIGGFCTGYLIFANPFTAFYKKPAYLNPNPLECFISTNQLDQISLTIKLASSNELLIYEGEKTIGKSITFQKYAEENKNVIYFLVTPQNPESIIDTLLSELGDYDYSDIVIPLLKVFGPKKSKYDRNLVEYLLKFPNLRIEGKTPIIIIDNFDYLYNENEKIALKLLASARLLLRRYQFIFVATEGYLSRSALAHEGRIYFKEFPALDKFERMKFAKCHMSLNCPDYQLTGSSISEYLAASFFINIRFLNALCQFNIRIESEEDLKLLVSKKTDLQLYLMINFEASKLDFFTADKGEILNRIEKPILETIFQLIDNEAIPYKFTLPPEITKKDVFKILISNNTGDKTIAFQTKFHQLLAEIKFGNKTSNLRRDFERLLNHSKEAS